MRMAFLTLFSLACCSGLLGVCLFPFLFQPTYEANLWLYYFTFVFWALFTVAVVNATILTWVSGDAHARGLDPGVWTASVMTYGVLALLIYLFSRPSGDLVECDECGEWHLERKRRCPHCGY